MLQYMQVTVIHFPVLVPVKMVKSEVVLIILYLTEKTTELQENYVWGRWVGWGVG